MRRSILHILSVLLGLLSCGPALAWNPSSGDFSKGSASDLRLMAWNVLDNLVNGTTTERAALARILQAADPDIIAFEEVDESLTFSQIRAELDSILPLGAGTSWTVRIGLSDGFNRNVLAARWSHSMPIQDTTPASEVRGVVGMLVDLPSSYPRDIYVMGVHLKCCSGASETARRQQHCDALAKWFGDIRSSGGNINLPTNTPVVVMGDFNFVDADPQQPEVTLRTGDIQDNTTYGADIKGDWDASDLLDVQPACPFNSDKDTWPTGTTNPSSRLDRFYITNSAMTVVRSFILNTESMTSGARSGAGLNFSDSETASDHLPIIMDLNSIVPVAVSAFSAE